MSGVIATPTRTPKKRSKPKKTGPTVSDLIVKVVSASTNRSGVSLPALKKSLAAGGYDVTKNKARIKTGVRRLVANGALLQPKGTGASGSFKINKKQPAAKKKIVKKKKIKSPRKKAKRGSPKKPAGAKKSPARKKIKAKSPKKAKKPAAAKKPKTAKLSVAMSTRAKTQK